MFGILIRTLILSLFVNHVLCILSFMRPPQWYSDVDDKAGFEENIRYEVGDTVQLLWETDLDKVELFLVQRIGSIIKVRILDASRTEWKAEWDVVGLVDGNEDSLYWFALRDPDDRVVYLRRSQSFNVSAPPTQLIPIPTATDQSSNKKANSDAGSDSGMSRSEIAGAAVGGTIGGLILLGAVGWLIWRRLGQNKRNTDVSVVSQSQQQQFHSSETKAELPGDPPVESYPSGTSDNSEVDVRLRPSDVIGCMIATFASLAACESKFIRPPQWDPNQGADRDLGKNIRYSDSENIAVIFESDEPKVDLWKAEYDMGRYLRHGEDSVYWFGTYKSGDQQTPLAESQYFNVTAPDPPQLHTVTVSEAVTSVQESATLQLPPQSTTESGSDATATEVPSGQETKANTGLSSRFELTTTEIVGITVGASLGGVVVLGGIGWLGCRKSARRGTRNRPGAHYQEPYQWGIKERERALYLSAPARRIVKTKMSLQFTTLDVFTTSAFEGNPLAVVTIPPPSQQAPLTQSQKQRIAREFNLSETVFVHDVENRAETDERKIDIFTPQFELPFAGHPTIGTAVFLQPQGVKTMIAKAGRIDLEFENGSPRALIPHDVKLHKERVPKHEIEGGWDGKLAEVAAADEGAPLFSIVNGMTFALVNLPSLELLGAAKVGAMGYIDGDLQDDGWKHDFDSRRYYYTLLDGETSSDGKHVQNLRTRLVKRTMEDPATGSAACALSCYLALHKLSANSIRFNITQGVEMGRESLIVVDVEVETDGAGERKVKTVHLSGKAVEVMKGTVRVPQ
ncbi:hypothetical protein FOXB_06741 [Fusarium oxysporum f. sp. conglutinans Fo5176]|uniref:Phenazine biosynthesis protein n=4 Tax=Fusarium oxysporum TaxID=5507 RepID=F9FK12_FUSOF|nr:hypothetical protein FOXB_06741 [Fusarium oxysporum f. sp. conglutinans Fo5176]